jgi:hypothetical protein
MAGCTEMSYQMIAACGALRTLAVVNSPPRSGFGKGRRAVVRGLSEGMREIP